MAYNPPIGSIYHLYITYSPCLLGGYIIRATLYRNLKNPLILTRYLEDLGSLGYGSFAVEGMKQMNPTHHQKRVDFQRFWGAEGYTKTGNGANFFEVVLDYTNMGVSQNNGTPKSSILIGFSIIFPIHVGIPLFLETHFCCVTVCLDNY